MGVAAAVQESAEQRLLDHLRKAGKLDNESADRAWRVFEHTRVSLTKILLELGLVPERDLVAAFTDGLGIPVADAAEYPIEPVLPENATERFLKDSKTVLLAANDDTVTIASADPLDSFVTDALALATSRRVIVKAGTSTDIEEALRRLYANTDAEALSATASENGQGSTDADVARLRESASEAPVIRFVNTLISRAVEAGASDIHIEPLERRLRIRTRIDGVLKEEEPAAVELAPAIVSRLKIMSGLNIAERRLPQDGAVKLAVRGKEIDLRIATAPVTYGESVAVRILDKSSVALDFDALGFDAGLQSKLGALLDKPNGIFLVSGPTGSGKTTTLYAGLQRLNTAERKILSVEDPVEYKIAGVNQVQVKPDIGLTFANVLRSFLRHDPDVILVGEIRDPETARIAVQAALTGHLVLSTVHTNSAAGALTRLLDMHVEDYLLTSTVVGILSQRLVRVLCHACKEPTTLGPEWRAELKAMNAPLSVRVFRAKGCPACNGTGYKGRTVLSEILVPDERVRRLVAERGGATQIHAAAIAGGMESLRRNGLRKVLEGVTTVEEVSRVAQEET
ncbi:MAG: type II/IV secretion system protein [Alphaproteobacteria bacterium]|nr:type II/IV secretion system protein [Alphaproteobacteria bacterium]